MAEAAINLPDTSTPPDNIYFDGSAISWDFEFDGKKATFGHIQPDFHETFPVADGGERITLIEPEEDAYLSINALGGELKNRVDDARDLERDGDTMFVPEGKNMWVNTGSKAVQYVCIYPGQSAEA